MKDSARYPKIVEWSEEDRCYVGSAPDLILGGCHGDDERAVFDELCRIVDEVIETFKRDGTPLPPVATTVASTDGIRHFSARRKRATNSRIEK